jgi:hypothetical protein
MITVSLYCFNIQNLISYNYKQKSDKFVLCVNDFNLSSNNLNKIHDDSEVVIEKFKNVNFFDIINIAYPLFIPFYTYNLLSKEDISNFLKLFLNKN